MLDMIFGFNARIGRLMFFMGSIALNVVNLALAIPLAYYLYKQGAAGHMPASIWSAGTPVYAFLGFSLLGYFMLSSMRVRDIGWDPIIIIPTWIAITVADHLMASHLPGLAAQFGNSSMSHGTIVGGLFNLAMTLVLLFHPSGEPTKMSLTFDDDDPPPSPDAPKRNAAAMPAQRLAKAGQFGRRG